MSEQRVFGWKCPELGPEWSGQRSYRVWYWLYRNTRITRHWLGIHDKQGHYSIAPRCDWCGHRSPEQRRIAKRNWDALETPHPHAEAATTTTECEQCLCPVFRQPEDRP